MSNLDILDSITEKVRETFEAKNAARDAAINQSRTLIQHCANAIRAVHRHEWETAQTRLQAAHQEADRLRAQVAAYPDLSGYDVYMSGPPPMIKAGMDASLTGNEPGLAGWWKFDDPANPGHDSSAEGHDGRLMDGATLVRLDGRSR